MKPVAAGEGVSYGLRHHVDRDTVVATLPIGYADGVFRGARRSPARRCSSAAAGARWSASSRWTR